MSIDASLKHNNMPGTDLGQQVHGALRSRGYREHLNLSCESDGPTVTLKGKLTSYYLTQIAQTIAMKVPGVGTVVNEIDVCELPTHPR